MGDAARNIEVELFLDCRNELGECPIWDEVREELIWVNIHAGEVWRRHLASGAVSTHTIPGRQACAVALRESGGLLVATDAGFGLMDPDSGAFEEIGVVEPELPTTRRNDSRVDRQGRLIGGGMDDAEVRTNISTVYRLDTDLSIHPLLGEVACSNSICFSLDGATMYHTNMPTGVIMAYAYDRDTGVPHSPRVFTDLADQPGGPDGSVIDSEDYLWNAQFGGARIVRYAPDGRIDRVVELPVSNPTCVTFGGTELDVMFVTTAWAELPPGQREREPTAGSIFCFDPGVTGVPEERFRG